MVIVSFNFGLSKSLVAEGLLGRWLMGKPDSGCGRNPSFLKTGPSAVDGNKGLMYEACMPIFSDNSLNGISGLLGRLGQLGLRSNMNLVLIAGQIFHHPKISINFQ